MNLIKAWKKINWINLAQVKENCFIIVTAVMILPVPHAGNS
jgi:hypothetical protein